MFSATLGLVDIVKGTNSYYKLQLLEDDRESRCVWGWGRVPRGGPVREWASEGCGEVFGQREAWLPAIQCPNFPGHAVLPSLETLCLQPLEESRVPEPRGLTWTWSSWQVETASLLGLQLVVENQMLCSCGLGGGGIMLVPTKP